MPLPAAPTPSRRPSLRRSLGFSYYSVPLVSVFYATITGGAVPLLCDLAHLSDRAYGLVAALPYAAALIQFPAALLLTHLSRRTLFLPTAALQRLTWIPVAALPLLFAPSPNRTLLFLSLTALAFTAGSAAGLAWQSWMSDLIPPRRRGTWLGGRNRLFSAGLLACSLLAAAFLPDLTEPHAGVILLLFFTAAALAGTAEAACYAFVEDLPLRHPPPKGDLLKQITTPLKDPHFLPFLLFGSTVTAATAVIGPFLWRHFLGPLAFSPLKTTLILQTSPYLANLLLSRTWGRLMDRHGIKPTLFTATLIGTLVTLTWPLITPTYWYLGLITAFAGQLFWVGVDVGLQSTIIRHAARPGGAAYAAAYNSATACAAFAAGLLAGECSTRLAHARWVAVLADKLAPHNIAFTPYIVILAFTIIARFAALPLFLRTLPNDRPTKTLPAIRLMASGLYSSLSQLLATPVKLPLAPRRPPSPAGRAQE